MRIPKRSAPVWIALFLAAGFLSVSAQDLSPYDSGARASGLAGAFTAKANDVTAIFANPAGLAFLKGFRLKTNLIFSKPNMTASFPALGASFTSSPSDFRGSLALSWQVANRLSVGIGVFAPCAFETDWNFRWPGRYASIKAGMNGVVVRPVVSAEIIKGLALGIGVDFVFSKLSWQHYQPFRLGNFSLPGPVGIDSRFELSGTGTGFAAGLLWKPHPAIQAGVRYVHPVAVDFSGRDVFVFPADEVGWMTVPDPVKPKIPLENLVNLYYKGQDFSSPVTLPREVAFGAALAPMAALSFTIDLQWDEWSRFGSWQFRAVNDDQNLSPGFTKALQDFYGIAPDYGLQSAGLVLKDAWKIKAGLEYRPAPHLALRGGFAHHQSPAGNANQIPIDPIPDQNIAAIGFGYEGPVFDVYNTKQVGELSFDVYCRYVKSAGGSGTIPGYELTYQFSRWEFGVGVGVNL
jgi:long-subunit fatty acid transport protein